MVLGGRFVLWARRPADDESVCDRSGERKAIPVRVRTHRPKVHDAVDRPRRGMKAVDPGDHAPVVVDRERAGRIRRIERRQHVRAGIVPHHRLGEIASDDLAVIADAPRRRRRVEERVRPAVEDEGMAVADVVRRPEPTDDHAAAVDARRSNHPRVAPVRCRKTDATLIGGPDERRRVVAEGFAVADDLAEIVEGGCVASEAFGKDADVVHRAIAGPEARVVVASGGQTRSRDLAVRVDGAGGRPTAQVGHRVLLSEER